MYTDHEALKSLLHTPHLPGKLAQWGMALQELDLKIEYCPGSKNLKADTLSRYPLLSTMDEESILPVIVAIATERAEPALAERQRVDPYLMSVIAYLEDNVLPRDDKEARELILGRSQYVLNDEILYRVETDKTLRVVVPKSDREDLFMKVHTGKFGGHLREVKIHSKLSRHNWWPTIRQDINRWCRASLTCASCNVGKPFKPLLTPIPVGGPFNRLGLVSMCCSYQSHPVATIML